MWVYCHSVTYFELYFSSPPARSDIYWVFSAIRLKWRSELIESRAPRPSSPAALLSWITACFHIHIVGEAAREAGRRCLEEGNSCTALLERDGWGSERKAQTGQRKQAAAWCTLHAWDADQHLFTFSQVEWKLPDLPATMMMNVKEMCIRWFTGVWVQMMRKDVAVGAELTGLIWVD